MILRHPRVTAAQVSCLALVVSGVCSFSASGPAVAGTDEDVLTATVRFDDLNLATRHGAEQLYRRINVAAYKVCWPLDHGNIQGMAELNACLQRAVARAVAKLDLPAVTALHEHRHATSALAGAAQRK